MSVRRVVPLREIARLDLDIVAVLGAEEYPIAGVYGFGRGLIDRGAIRGSETSYSRLQRLRSGQVVFSRLKAFEGAVALVPPRFDGYFVSQEFPTFTIDQSKASVDYVAHLCRWPDLWEKLGSGSKGIGARRERLHADDFLAIEISLPPLDEQRRIAVRLDRISRTAESVNLRLGRAELLASSILPSMARRGDRHVPLGDLVHRVSRSEPVDPHCVYQLLGVRWYGQGLFVRERKDGRDVSALKVFRVETGDLVYNRLFAWKGSFAVADASVAGSYVSIEFPTFQIDATAIEPAYLMSVLRDPRVWDAALERSSGSTPTSRNRLKEERFLELQIPLPDREDQTRVGKIATSLSVNAERRAQQRERLGAMVPAVLNRAFAELS